MTRLGGSFRFADLPAVTQLLAELGSTGRLCVSHAEWTGEIVLREGQIVAARLGAEQGRAALEAIAVALSDGEFSFTEEPVAETSQALVAAAERMAYLDRLGAERQRLMQLIPSFGLVPRLVAASDGNSEAAHQVTIGAAALQLIPSLVFGFTLEHVARQRGLVRTLREVAELMEGGLVKLEPKPNVATSEPAVSEPAVSEPAVVERPPLAAPPALPQRLSARPFAARSSAAAGQSIAMGESTPPAVAHQGVPRLAWARQSPLHTVSAQPRPQPVIPPGIAVHLSAARAITAEPPPAAPSAIPQPVPVAGWRKALVGFFLNDDKPEVHAR